MRAYRISCLVCAAILLLIAARPARAQQDQNFETGLEPFKSYHGGNIDTINLSNGGLTLDIPIISYPQRGGKLNLNFVLHYWNGGSSSYEYCYDDGYGDEYCCVYPTSSSDMCWPGDNELCHGFALFDKDAEFLGTDGSPSPGPGDIWLQWPDGTTHPLAASSATLSGGYLPVAAVDGSGFKYSFSSNVTTGPDGTTYGANSGVYYREDVNGNKITLNPWTDTLGHSIDSIPSPLQDYPGGEGTDSGALTDLSPCSGLGTQTTTSAYKWIAQGLGGSETYPVIFCYESSIAETEPIFGYTYTPSELQSVILPDGTAWIFQYTTDGNADLAKVTFPTGGSLSYTWYNDCVTDYGYTNPRLVVARSLNPNDGTTSASTWDYAQNSSCYYNDQTTVTAPSSSSYTAVDDTVHSFSGTYETQTKYYQGSSSGGTLLKTVNTAYQGLPSCYYSSPALPSSVTTIWPNNQQSETTMSYDSALTLYYGGCSDSGTASSLGRLLSKQEYDYGTGAPGSLLKTTTTSYLAFTYSPYLTNNLLDLPYTVQIKDGGGTQRAYSIYTYDGVSLVSSGITMIDGATVHDSSPPAGSYRGNLTSVSQWLNTTSGYLTNYKTYYDTGTVQNAVDANGSSATDSSHMTTYSYDSTGTFPTEIQYPTTSSIAHEEYFTYNTYVGLMLTHQGQNGMSETTSYAYDPMLRPLSVTFPDTGHVEYCYTETGTESGGATCSASGPPYDVVIAQAISSGVNKTSTAVIDGVGRLFQAQLNSDPSGTDYTDYRYDGLGRTYSVSNPHRSSSSSTDGTTYYSYDPLNRVATVTDQDNSTVTTSYADSTSLHAFCTTVTDEAGNKRESCTDGLGRVTSAWEDPSGSNFETDYTYDTLDDLTGVTQKGGTTSSYWRTRSFTYDSLSRLLSATNPESGTTCYGTYSGSTCQANGYDANGNLLYKTDARGVVINYSPSGSPIDALNRVTEKTYSDGTPTATFIYDVSSIDGVTIQYPIGRLVNASTYASSSNFSYIMRSYDSMGRALTQWQWSPARYAAGPYAFYVTASYNLLGLPTADSFEWETSTLSTQYDAAGRPTEITSSLSDSDHPGTPVSGITYWPPGAMETLSYANGLTGSSYYNNRMQPCRMNVNSSSTALSSCTGSVPSGNVQDFQYGFNYGSSDNGNVVSWNGSGQLPFTRSYAYGDHLNRLTGLSDSTSGNPCSALSWTYDPWGNRLTQSIASGGSSCGTWSQSYTTLNQISNGGTCVFCYDAAGNLTSDGSHSYFYDAENRLIQVDGTLGTCSTATACYIYDAEGHRVQKTTSSATTAYVYDIVTGKVLEETNGSDTMEVGYIYLGGQLVAQYDNGTTHFAQLDHLGTTRLLTDLSGSVCNSMDFLPFGESNGSSGSCSTTHQFTGQERDPESGLDNFIARYYSSQDGRFMSPDPSGIDLADWSDPQQLNLYAYVRNNPITLTDPDGLDCAYLNNQGNDIESVDTNSSSGECTSTGGYWVTGQVNQVSVNDNGTYQFGYSGVGENGSIQSITYNSYLAPEPNTFGQFLSDAFWSYGALFTDAQPTTYGQQQALASNRLFLGLVAPGGEGEASELIKPTAGQVSYVSRILATEGKAALEKSVTSWEKLLSEHLADVETYKQAGGFTSSVEREIKNFSALIQAAKELLGRTP